MATLTGKHDDNPLCFGVAYFKTNPFKEVSVMRVHQNHPSYVLLGGAITILKNMKVNGKDYPIYYGK